MTGRSWIVVAVISICLAPEIRAQQPGSCANGLAEDYLAINNVRARVMNTGGLFWRGDPAVYEVPAWGGESAIFAAGIWIGGVMNGELRLAGSTYGPYEFWPGPLNENGALPSPHDCSEYDRIFEITASDVERYEETGEMSDNLRGWPWALGAPVLDGDGVPDNYNLEGGDRPDVLGHQMLWWVMNDLGNLHMRTGGDPHGIEVQVSAFAVSAPGRYIDDATLYKYKLVNRQPFPLEDVYFSFWVDPDLGNFNDDYVGSDTTLGMAFVYNADNDDEGHYGVAPPALGVDFIQGPLVEADGRDNDRDGEADEPGERQPISSFMYYNGGGCVTCDPQTAVDYYGYMQSKWRDGKHLTYGGSGRGFSEEPTDYMFPGDPVTRSFWSEINSDSMGTPIDPADRRFIATSGPFTLAPGDPQDIVVAVIWARGADHLDSVAKLREASVEVESAWYEGLPTPPLATISGRPVLLAPGDRAGDQPVDVVLRWDPLSSVPGQEVEVARTPDFADVILLESLPSDVARLALSGLEAGSAYYWRVTAEGRGQAGVSSETFSFTVASDARVTPGPLLIGGREGAYAWVEIVGVTEDGTVIDPCGPQAGSTAGCDEVGGNNVWESLNSTASYFLSAVSGDGPEASIGLYAPNDFELRFTEEGSIAIHPWTTRRLVRVPFEVWDVGSLEPGGSNDPSDDRRLIPALFSDSGGECAFDVERPEDPTFGFPVSDRINAFYGALTYEQWEASVISLVAGDPAGCPILPDSMELPFDTLSPPPVHNLFVGDFDDDGELPQPPTTIRFYTAGSNVPLPASPANASTVTRLHPTLWWTTRDGRLPHQVQVSTSATFDGTLVDTSGVVDGRLDIGPLEQSTTYYWRIRFDTPLETPWSEPWSFTTAVDAGAERDELPEQVSLMQPYPNPFSQSTQIRFSMSRAAPVEVSVYDLLGRRVTTLLDAQKGAGTHEIAWAPSGLGSGVYWVWLESGGVRTVRSVLLLR